MINCLEFIEKYQLCVRKYDYKKGVRILTLDDKKIVIKESKRNKRELFSYLDSKDFRYALKPTNLDQDDLYEIYPFIEESVKDRSEKAVDMMYILSLLHNKTSFYKELVLDDMKALYEEIRERLEYLYYYYRDIQDILEKRIYMAPDEYLLIRNISLVYQNLEYARVKMEQWYEQIKNIKSIRYVLLHSNVSTEHFLQGDGAYFISWDHARRDFPIYDFLAFFQNDYQTLDMNSLYQIYKHKYPFTKEEETLLFALLSIPAKLSMGSNTYNQYHQVYHFVLYLRKSQEFLSKQDQDYQKANE